MEALLLITVVLGLFLSALGVAFAARLWTTLGEVRRAANAIHYELAHRRLERAKAAPGPLGHVPEQESPHRRWNLPGDQA
jgi:hypothetical protein